MPKIIFKTPKFKGWKRKRPLEYPSYVQFNSYFSIQPCIYIKGQPRERGGKGRSVLDASFHALACGPAAPCSEPETQGLYLSC